MDNKYAKVLHNFGSTQVTKKNESVYIDVRVHLYF